MYAPLSRGPVDVLVDWQAVVLNAIICKGMRSQHYLYCACGHYMYMCMCMCEYTSMYRVYLVFECRWAIKFFVLKIKLFPSAYALQVTEMYSSGGELHLELLTGQPHGTKSLWVSVGSYTCTHI